MNVFEIVAGQIVTDVAEFSAFSELAPRPQSGVRKNNDAVARTQSACDEHCAGTRDTRQPESERRGGTRDVRPGVLAHCRWVQHSIDPGFARGPSGMTTDRPMASIRPPTSLLKRQVIKLARPEAHVEITIFARH